MKKQLQDKEVEMAQEVMRLKELMRRAQEDRAASEHRIKLAGADVLAAKEGEAVEAQKEAEKRVKTLEEKLVSADLKRLRAEEELREAKNSIQGLRLEHEERLIQQQDAMRTEEEKRLELLDEKISSIQQARDLQQARADQQAFEIQELHRLENARLKQHDALIKRDADLRLKAEQLAEERQNEVEQLKIDHMHMKQRVAAAEATAERAEKQAAHRQSLQESAVQQAVEEGESQREALDNLLAKAEERNAALETEIRENEVEAASALMRQKDAEMRRLADAEDRILQKVKAELSKTRAMAQSS